MTDTNRKTVTATITGEQGAGKTILALALARIMEEKGFYVAERTQMGTTRKGDDGFDAVVFEFSAEDRNRLAHYGRDLPKSETLDHKTKDRHGLSVADLDWIGLRLRHTGNGKVYEITGYAWMGETDEWGFIHRAVSERNMLTGTALVRPLAHRDGKRADGTRRYKKLTSDGLEVEEALEVFGLDATQRSGEGWMVIGTDNYNRDHIADFIVARDFRSESDAKLAADGLNEARKFSDTHYLHVKHDHKLGRGMEDLV